MKKITLPLTIIVILVVGYLVFTAKPADNQNGTVQPPPTPPQNMQIEQFEGILSVTIGDDFANKKAYYVNTLLEITDVARYYYLDLSNVEGVLDGSEYLGWQNKPVRVTGYLDGRTIIVQIIELRDE